MSWLRFLARKIWLLAVTLVIALALVVQTGRMLSPQVTEYRAPISDWLSQRLGAPVAMDGLSLRWQALEVALQVDGLRLGEAGQVRLGRGLLHLDLLASLWHRELVWKNLEADDFSAVLSRRAGGGWQIEGFPTAPAQAGGDVRLDDPVRIFQLGPKVQVRNARIELNLGEGQVARLQVPEILLENSGDFHRLTARATVSGAAASLRSGGETLRLVLEGRGNPRSEQRFSLRGHLQLNELLIDSDLIALVNQLSPLPADYHWSGRKLAQGSLWLESESQGYGLRGQLQLEQVQGGASEQREGAEASTLDSLRALSAEVSGRWRPAGDWQLALQNTRLQWREAQIPSLNLQARGAGGELHLALDRVDLAAWNRVLQELQLVRGAADEWLQALAPEGTLENLHLAHSATREFTLRANLRDVAAGAHRGAPAVAGVNGYLELSGRGGRVELDSTAGFSAHFPALYRQAFEFQSARGTVAWSLDAERNSVQVYSGPLRLKGELGDVGGQFLLQLPHEAHTRAAEFTLALGLRDAAASSQELMVPYPVSGELRNWLSSSVGRKNPGRVPRAGFIYRGTSYGDGSRRALRALGEHAERQTVQLLADVENGSLDYAPGWPAARQVNARLLVSDRNVQVNAREAMLWNVRASDVEVGVTPAASGSGSLLGVRAQLAGPAADGLKLLRESPLREHLGAAFDDWKLRGQLHGSLTLSQPLGGDQPARQTLDLELAAGNLELGNLGLDVQGLSGEVHYDTARGLAGTRVNGRLWGEAVRAEIDHPEEGGERDTRVLIQGQGSAAAVLDWSGYRELEWLRGDFDYRAAVTIPAAARALPYAAVLEVTSDLEGLAVDLPQPFGKAEAADTRFLLRAPIGAQGSLFHLHYGEHLQGQFWLTDGQLERAAIALNAEVELPAERAIGIRGHLGQVDLAEWRKLLHSHGAPATAPEDGQRPLPVILDLSADQLLLGAGSIDDIQVSGRGTDSGWRLQLDSRTAAGTLSGRLDGSEPLELHLAHLEIPAPQADEQADERAEEKAETPEDGARPDPWAGFDFASLPAVNFRTDSLRLGEEDFGHWSFRLRPSPGRLVVSDIQGALRGMRIEGRGEGENRLGAQLMWLRDADGRESSQFIGRLRAGDLARVLQSWGQEPAIESESAVFDTALRWDGSPARVGGDVLSGELKVDIRGGRFLRASDNAGSALLRLLSLFNFDTWARRLRLDFSDLYQSGMAFDRVRGEVFFEGDGELLIAVPIQVEGPTSELQMAGRVNLEREDLNLTLVATLPVGNNLALVAALAGGLPAAAGVYLISKAFKKQVSKMASVSYRISGDWSDPQVRFDKLFDGEGASRQGTAAGRREPAGAQGEAQREAQGEEKGPPSSG